MNVIIADEWCGYWTSKNHHSSKNAETADKTAWTEAAQTAPVKETIIQVTSCYILQAQ